MQIAKRFHCRFTLDRLLAFSALGAASLTMIGLIPGVRAQKPPEIAKSAPFKIGQFSVTARNGSFLADSNKRQKTTTVTLEAPKIELRSVSFDLDAKKVVALVDETTRLARTVDATGSVRVTVRQPEIGRTNVVECDTVNYRAGTERGTGRIDFHGNIRTLTYDRAADGPVIGTATGGYILLRGDEGTQVHFDNFDVRGTANDPTPAPKKAKP